METGKSKEKRGGAKSGRRRRRKVIYRTQGAGVAKGTILPQHGWACVIHRSQAGHGYPRQQLGQDSLFVALSAVSCRMWSPA